MSEQQDESLQQRDLEQHESRTERPEVREPPGPTTTRPLAANEQRTDDEQQNERRRNSE